ncbi:hypothetical protein J6590_097582 [Homalodisca vitripennis]|nr:hypothetical protein J6590_097582 [Homalodisca vitripennis]
MIARRNVRWLCPCLASAVERRGTTTVNLAPAGVYSAWPQQSKNVQLRPVSTQLGLSSQKMYRYGNGEFLSGRFPLSLASAVKKCRGTTTVNLAPAGVYSAWPQQSKNVQVRERLASAVKKCEIAGTVVQSGFGFHSAWPQRLKNVRYGNGEFDPAGFLSAWPQQSRM